jgi:hypothetical protein
MITKTTCDRFHLSMAMYRQAIYRYATYCIAMSPTSQYVMAPSCHVFHCHHSLHRARMTFCHKFTHPRVIFQITLDDSLLDTSLRSLLHVLVFLPLQLPNIPVAFGPCKRSGTSDPNDWRTFETTALSLRTAHQRGR